MDGLLDIGIAVLALYLTLSTLRFVRTARRVQGTLVGYQSERDDEGDWLHRPIFRFAAFNGQLITASNPTHIWIVRRLAVGENCALLYNPSDHAQVRRDTWLDLWFLPTVLWVVSILALVHALGS